MPLQPFCASLKKELLLLLRDPPGLLLIFAMPAVFVLIMSLALQEQFSVRGGKKIDVAFIDRDGSEASAALRQRLEAAAFEVTPTEATDAAAAKALLQTDRFVFAIEVAAGYADTLQMQQQGEPTASVALWVGADTSRQTEQIVAAALREIIAGQRLDTMLATLQDAASDMQAVVGAFKQDSLKIRYTYTQTAAQAPTAVQQNVPAWLVFGAFFVVIPLSNTLIRERQSGMLRRLRASAVSWRVILGSKWMAFFIVNQLQMLLMFAVGVFLVPLLGGQALQLHGSLLALALMAASLSVAALGYALLIAVCSRTTEQATLLGGVGNIILAAIGGVMIPRFVMPQGMQAVSDWSPMAWGLNGFLDVLLRDAGIVQVAGDALALCAFGAATLAAAFYVLHRGRE